MDLKFFLEIFILKMEVKFYLETLRITYNITRYNNPVNLKLNVRLRWGHAPHSVKGWSYKLVEGRFLHWSNISSGHEELKFIFTNKKKKEN
jgi:hypothetical protein